MASRFIRTIDLFAGAGGLSLGFELADRGYKPVLAVESDAVAARTYKQHFGCDVWNGPIEFVNVDDYPKADVILGGPPCQGFSPLGRKGRDPTRMRLNVLWRHFVDAVRKVQPRAFVIENVPEFYRSTQFERFRKLLANDEELSHYSYEFGVLNAADYGVPQRRLRGLLVAVANNTHVPWPPAPTHGPQVLDMPPYVTVSDAIGDLARNPSSTEILWDPAGRQDLHFGRRPNEISLARYSVIPEGGNRFDLAREREDLLPPCWANKPTGTTDVMGRLWWERPAVTIRTEFFKPEKGRYLHPTEDRPITHREAARLQSFPDEFVFEGSKGEVARQIGNAVPPLLGRALADHVFKVAFSKRR